MRSRLRWLRRRLSPRLHRQEQLQSAVISGRSREGGSVYDTGEAAF